MLEIPDAWCVEGKAIEMSFDHKPEDDPERDRITKAGGRVTPDGRVNGGLNLSRAIGDHAYKTNKKLPLSEQMISPVPDVKRLTINPETDSYIFLACDGIWNSLNSQEVVDFINERLLNNNEKDDDEKSDPMGTDRLTKVLGELFDHCLAPDTMGDGTGCDNMTAVIAKLKPNAFREGKDKVICDESMKEEKERKEEEEEVQQNETEKRPLAADDVKEEQPEAKRAKTEATAESPAVEEAATDVEAADESTTKDEDERKEKA